MIGKESFERLGYNSRMITCVELVYNTISQTKKEKTFL